MPDLEPAPDTLGLASPSVGPWFDHNNATLPILGLPDSDLAITVSMDIGMQWLAPAGGTRSYAVATQERPPILRKLRNANGDKAFADDSLVVLHTLLPEVELRLWTLTQVVPQPDNSPLTAANTPSRLRIRSFALEIPNPPTDLNKLREVDLAPESEFNTDEKRAEFLGLILNGNFDNATATFEISRPNDNSEVLFENRTDALIDDARLWCFDHRGRAVDAGSVASMWSFMSDPDNTAVWNNLATQINPLSSRTAATSAGQIAHLVSASEGRLDDAIESRLVASDELGLAPIENSSTLFTVDSTSTLQLIEVDTESDLVPIPRMAPLPNGPYAPIPVAPSDASGALFSGWTSSTTPFALTRDYMRIAMVDVEKHSVGVGRDTTAQSDELTRLAPLQNSANNPVLLNMDAVTAPIMTTLSGGSTVAMAPVMDSHSGSSTPFAAGTAALPTQINYNVLPLAGEGNNDQGSSTSQNQSVLIDINTPDVPSDGWVRIWTHARDKDTGKRIRLDGGAAGFDGSGLARVVVPIPDGTSGPSIETDSETGTQSDPVFISFDVMVTSAGLSAFFPDQRLIRPAVSGGTRVNAVDLDGSESLFVCERAFETDIDNLLLRAGEHVLVVSDDPQNTPHALIDTTTLLAANRVPNTLSNAATADDTLITSSPAFTDTPEGSLPTSGGATTRVHRARNLLTDPGTLGAPAPSMERLEVVALDQDNTAPTGVIGAGELREQNHESAPPQLAHLGLPAAAEIGAQGLTLAGPAVLALTPLMDERRSQNLVEYLSAVSTVSPTVNPVTGTTRWSAVLETIAHGVTGDATVRAFVNSALADLTPGQSWDALTDSIETATGQDLNDFIDFVNLDLESATAVAAGVDRLIRKTAEGATEFARAVTSAISRAEDYIYIQTPCIDADTEGENLDWIDAIKQRWNERPGLSVMLVVPENYLPKRPDRLKDIRKAGINAALKALADANADRLALVTPVAGPGRPWHLASSAIVIDDVWLAMGTTHFWRRGLTFDSSLAATLFDENVTLGRPAAVRTARLQLMANSLGLAVNLVPDDPEDCLQAMQQLATGSGLGLVKPNVFMPTENETADIERAIWNPDGRPGEFSSWFGLFNDLINNGDADELSNAIR